MRENVCCLCGKPESKVGKLIAGPSGNFVCDECIDSCNTMLANELEEFAPNFGDSELEINLKTPHEMKAFLDEYVIGQDDAKKVLSVAVYNHYKRIVSNGNSESKVELQKSNVLMLGPTGSGKTYLVQNLARILGVPFCIADATSLTEAGYVGEDVETILLKLIQAADYDIKKAEIGIVYIDEIDKIAKKTESVSTSRDVSGEGVQQALLKLIEGTTANIPQQGERKHPGKELMQMDTKNVLFICGGAFVGIDEIIKKRLDETYPEERGKERTFDELFSSAMPHDFIKFGLIPEFIGRVPVTVSLNQLSENDMVHILREPKNSITKQYQELFKMDGVDLKFNPDALREIAKKTIERHTGARGLRSIVETVMMDYMYDIPSDPSIKTLTITKEMIDQNLKDKIHK